MSQSEHVLPDGRKTSDLKVVELKTELEKLNKSKSGIKDVLITRLNKALDESKEHVDLDKSSEPCELNESSDHNESDEENKESTIEKNINNVSNDESDMKSIDKQNLQNTEITEPVISTDDAILDKVITEEINDNYQSEDVSMDTSAQILIEDINQEKNLHPDALVIEAPIDETLNPIDELTHEEDVMVCKVGEEYDAGPSVDNSREELNNSEDLPQITANIIPKNIVDEDVDLDFSASPKNEGTQRTVITKNEDKEELYEGQIDQQMEEGEVLPITARLGKRKPRLSDEGHAPAKSSKLRETKGAGHKLEEPTRVQGPQKSRNIISEVLRIDNLVRPFTLVQFKEMLERSGAKVSDLWLNKIKSIAYVRYSDESIALTARETLDGCRWPSINPKLLAVDFSTLKEMEYMRNEEQEVTSSAAHTNNVGGGNSAIVTNITTASTSIATENHSHSSGIENQVNSSRHVSKRLQLHDQSSDRNKLNTARRKSPERHNNNDKEVDRHHNHHRSSKHNIDHNHQFSTNDMSAKSTGQQLASIPAPKTTLEDLFRKTKVQPSIYWLPVAKSDRNVVPTSTSMQAQITAATITNTTTINTTSSNKVRADLHETTNSARKYYTNQTRGY